MAPAQKITSSCAFMCFLWFLPREKSAPVRTVELLRVEHTCNRQAFCPGAICGNAPDGESGCPAYGRIRLRPPVRDEAVPMTDLCPGSIGLRRLEFAAHRPP